MGRALHVSRSLPPIISSTRLITSIEKPNCSSSSTENLLYNSSHGELPVYKHSCPNMCFVPLSARQSALAPKSTFRVCQSRIGGVLARWFSSESDCSESEWLETDDERGTGSQSYGRDPTSLHEAVGRKQVQGAWQEVLETESETDAETVSNTSQWMGFDDGGNVQHIKQKSSHYKKETYDVYKQLETGDEHATGSQSHSRDTTSRHPAAGCNQVQSAWQAAFETESDTDAETVTSTLQEMATGKDACMQHKRQKSYCYKEEADDDNEWAETDNEHGAGNQRHCRDTPSHHPAAGRKQAQRARQATYETEMETDAETVASTLKWRSIDNGGHAQRRRQKRYHSEEETSVEAGSSMSDWHGTDHDNDVEAQAHGGFESETEVAGSDLSDWAETDVDEQEIFETGRDKDDGNAVSSSLSRVRDLSHLKASPSNRSPGARVPERPSKKERSAGLSPRILRDDDVDDVEIESDLEGELQEEIEHQMAAETKIERPSVTWGILLTRDLRLLARESVLKYLETEGIDTTELKRVELPTTVEVMQTRLGFLRKIGLDDHTINNYPLVLGCSVQKNMVPVLKYLRKLGFLQHWVPIVLKKYPMILHASVIIDILPVIYFLRGLDIDAIDLPRVITKYPDVLGFKTEGTMSTSVAYLVSMGVNMRHVGHMLTEYPEILGMRVASVIKPKFEYLMSLGIPQMIVAKILERRPQVLGYHLENRMQLNVNRLLEIGIRKEAIAGMVSQFPELLGRVFVHMVEDHVSWFKQHLELDSDGVARMIEKMPQVIFMRTAMALERIRFLKSERFTVAEIGSMVTKCPQILVSSIHDSLRPNLTFLTKDMKRSSREVLDFPAFFTYSLHSRIIPRFKALSGRNENCSLDWLLNCSDLEFQKRLKAGFEGDGPVGHVFVMGGLLPGKPAIDEDEFESVENGKVAAL